MPLIKCFIMGSFCREYSGHLLGILDGLLREVWENLGGEIRGKAWESAKKHTFLLFVCEYVLISLIFSGNALILFHFHSKDINFH